MSQLPPHSRFKTKASDGDSSWGIQEHLLAVAVDLLAGANWQRGGGKGMKPKPLSRPGVEVKPVKLGGVSYDADKLDELLETYTGLNRR